MIDKILDNKDSMSMGMYEEIYQEALNNQDARILFMLAYYVKVADIKVLAEDILRMDSLRYISFFMRSITNVDKSKFVSRVLELGTARDAYYCLFDNRDLKDEDVFRLIEKAKELKHYYFLSLYHYFITLDRFNDQLFSELKKLSTDISKENYKEILKKRKKAELDAIELDVSDEFTTNRYIGRKDYVPDMIVLHSTLSYKKGIKDFYDEAREVSAHFIISEDGEVRQLVSLDDSAWANGTSINQTSDIYYRFSNNDIIRSRDYNANYYTFSIEHESVDGDLTEAQYEASIGVIMRIIEYVKEKYGYDFIIDKEHIVGHRDVNPIVRTVCPGNVFPMKRIIKDLQERI